MYSIGVIAVAASIRNIMDIDAEMQKYCNVTYLPYSSNEHLLYVYRQNVERFDALLFGGSYTYHIIKDQLGQIARPCAFFTIADRDYYRVIAQLAIQEPGLDFARVLMDAPEIPVNFQAVFDRPGVPLLDSEDDPKISYEDYWPLTLKRYQQIWQSGSVDWIITRFGSMESYLQQARIPYKLLLPSRESMLDTFFGLMVQLKEAAPPDTSVCLGMVEPHKDAKPDAIEVLAEAIDQCNRQLGELFLVYRHGGRLELTTNAATLQELTRQYTICPLLAFLERHIAFPVAIGWGCANNVIDAHRNADRALKEAMKQPVSAAYTVTADSYVIGPLASEPGVLFSGISAGQTPFARPHFLSAQYAEKISSALAAKGDNLLSAEDLASVLSVTVRSAARILGQLEAAGSANVQYKRSINRRGRPIKYYRIDPNSLK